MRLLSRWIFAVIAGAAMSGLVAVPASAAAPGFRDYNACQPEYVYSVITVYGNTFYGLPGGSYKDYNGTPYNAIATFTSTVTGTIGTSLSIGGSFSLSAIVTGAQATTSATLTVSVAAGLNNSIAITVPPYHFGHGSWGAWRWYTYGEYYYLTDRCTVTNVSYMKTWVPHVAPGWNTWISTT